MCMSNELHDLRFEEYVGQLAMAASYGISQLQHEENAVAKLQEVSCTTIKDSSNILA